MATATGEAAAETMHLQDRKVAYLHIAPISKIAGYASQEATPQEISPPRESLDPTQ